MNASSANSNEVALALAKVRRLERDRNVPGLIEQLSSPLEASKRVSVRGSAAMALGEIGDRTAVPYLIELLDDRRQDVRSFAAYSLGQIRDPRAAGPVLELLDDPDAIVRLSAAMTLEKLGPREAVAPLTKALDDPHPWVRLCAAEALVSIGGEVPSDLIRMAAQRESLIRWGRRKRWNQVLSKLS